MPYGTTSKRAGHIIACIVTDPSGATGTYYDENGKTMHASTQVSDPIYSER